MKKITLFAVLILTVSFVMATPNRAALVDCDRVVVTGDDITEQPENTPPTDNWVLYKRAAGDGATRVGPATPPSGVGSYEIVTPTGADKATLFNYDHVGTNLSDIDKIGYSTYRTAGSAQQVTALNIQVDINGLNTPGGFTTLVFEPVYNTAQGAVVSGQWQTWDAYMGGSAIWWSSNPINVAPNRDTFVTWQAIVQNNPDAVILGGFGLNQGSGNPALVAASDNLSIGYGGSCFTYDFEPYRVATSKDDCKDGGWQGVKTASGASFKNQGQCIQYVNTGK
ncbi:MAG TPA: hypothetical protein VN282_13975 [Pyrinomonadaceae bacterium]|nr:hypothetical protein [Pyrinomonadaceae bacterium]